MLFVAMASSWLSPKAEVRAAGPKGEGIFAVRPISAEETIAAFGGRIVTQPELARLADRVQRLSIQIDDALFVVCERPDPADHLNHSCEPNAGICGNILVTAMRAIDVGEEICYDYATSDSDPYDEFECACGTASCRRVVRGSDWKIERLQTQYAGRFSAYLRRKIDAERKPQTSVD